MYWSIIVGSTFAMAVAWLTMPFIIKIAERNNWLDKPDHRKVHSRPIPPLGGIAIFGSFWLLTAGMGLFADSPEIVFVFSASLILFLVSLKDDLRQLSPLFRLIAQFSVAAICYVGGLKLTGFYGIFGIGIVTPWLQFLLTILTIVTIINAVNLIDGINGLAGSLSLIAFLAFGIMFLNANLPIWGFLSFVVAGSVLGFLRYNFGQASVFMGDNGSTFLGLLLSVCLLKYLTLENGASVKASSLITGLSIICLPVLDLIRVSITRILRGRSPFSPDCGHIHHLLIARGKDHPGATIRIVTLQIVQFTLCQVLLPIYSPLVTISILAGIYYSYILALKLSLLFTEIKQMEYQRMRIGYPELPFSEGN